MSKFLLTATVLVAFTLLSIDRAPALDIHILFVGDSFTHGRYQPALGYNAGPGNAPGDSLVHDLLCPSLPCAGRKAASSPSNTR